MLGALSLSDGRTLEWSDNDVDSDASLVLHHGTTIAMDVWNSWLSRAAAQGIRAIALNRPGVGQSTRKPNRRVIDDVADLRELIAHLNIRSFVAIGWSGGGARAMGSSLIQGCIAVHTIAGISPVDPYDPETYAGISEERIETIKRYLADYSAVVNERGALFEEDLNLTYEQAIEILSGLPGFSNNEADYRVFAEDFKQSVHKALGNGPETDADDYSANISPWGFALSDVSTPVTLWHGEDDDDVLHSRGLYNHQHLKHSNFHSLPDQGHISIMVEHRDAILSSAIESLKSHPA